jgi:aldehyde:ferredoxin oxidoreductase
MSDFCLAGKILKIDLSNKKLEILRTRDYESSFLGGRGLNQSLLLKLRKNNISPFDANNILIFGPGRLVGTEIPGAVRMSIDSINVFSGGIGSSNIGGKFPYYLKSAGFDNIIITGRSETPVYLWISNDMVEIRDGKPLWGKSISETEQMLKSLTGEKEIYFVCIGPAGENRVWTSAIIEGNFRAAARCGLGAIMGSKNIKAIVVPKSDSNQVRIANPLRLSNSVQMLKKKLCSLPSIQRKKEIGTVASIPILNHNAAMPVRNFEDDYLPEEEMKLYMPERFKQLSLGAVDSCIFCPITCQHYYKGKSSIIYKKLEANTVWDFGPRLGLTSPEDILMCHELCTQFGLDIDSTASTICWAIDCFEKGILNNSDTEGFELRWGNSEIIFRLIKMIALREGIGKLLSEGSYRASLKIGNDSSRLSFNIKGQDLIEPMRSCRGWALGIAVSPRGGTHTRGAPQTEFYRVNREIGSKIWGIETAGSPLDYEGKAKLVIYYERLHAIMDSLGLCFFISNWSSPDLLGPKEIGDICCYALGEEFPEEKLMNIGERILTLEKIYNMIHTVFERKDDYPPDQFFDEPIKNGPFAGEKLDRRRWEELLTEYYSLHEWNPQTGLPTEEKLIKIDLKKYF